MFRAAIPNLGHLTPQEVLRQICGVKDYIPVRQNYYIYIKLLSHGIIIQVFSSDFSVRFAFV